MGNLGNNLYKDFLSGIDTGRENMKRIPEPPMKFYTTGYRITAKPSARKYGNSPAGSDDVQDQSGAVAGTGADMFAGTGAAMKAGTFTNIGVAGSIARKANGNTVGSPAGTSGMTGAASVKDSSGKTGTTLMNDVSGNAGLSTQIGETNGMDMSGRAQASDSGRKKANSNKTGFQLDFSDESLLNGIILSEILGKPKYLRKGRW